jgi:zinc transport system permease protein
MSVGLIFQEYFGIDTNINNILFGDMELANYYDLLFIIILTIITYIVLFYNFNSIILISLNKDLAVARGVRVKLIEIVILCIMSITIGICFKLIGSFMLFGILIIPPTIARLFSGSPQEMIIKTIIISITTSIISAILAEMTHINISQLLICLNFVIFIFSKIILQIYKK